MDNVFCGDEFESSLNTLMEKSVEVSNKIEDVSNKIEGYMRRAKRSKAQIEQERAREDEQLREKRKREDDERYDKQKKMLRGLESREASLMQEASDINLRLIQQKRHQKLYGPTATAGTLPSVREPAIDATATPRPAGQSTHASITPSHPEQTLPHSERSSATPPATSPSGTSITTSSTRGPTAESQDSEPSASTGHPAQAHGDTMGPVFLLDGISYILWCPDCEDRGEPQPSFTTRGGFQNHLLKREGYKPGSVAQSELLKDFGREVVEVSPSQ